LAGPWERRVAGALVDVVEVPSSLSPSGSYRLQRELLLPALSATQCAILHFDAIAYQGTVWVNGQRLGEMGPYVPHEFDLTLYTVAGRNILAVDMVDIGTGPNGEGATETSVGLNPGWEGYGGIIRDVYVEVRATAYIDNVRFSYTLADDYRAAVCQTRVYVVAATSVQGSIKLVLNDGSREVARAEQSLSIPAGVSESEFSFTVPTPALWSPESPVCYRLIASLQTDDGVDAFSCMTGFRSFVVRGNTFELNGKPVVLKGVCRHDLWQDQGFTLTREQMAQDMRLIKALGANFVRLVHYPHHRHVVELADELGLMVSEEPGYWQVDFKTVDRPVIDVGLRILERAIKRDWNSPSVVVWLLANESFNTESYIREGQALCRFLDAWQRPVSQAGPMGKGDGFPAKQGVSQFDGMDFTTAHPYTLELAAFRRVVEAHGANRPIVFTEWGGKTCGFPQPTDPLRWDTVDHFLDLIEEGKLAGHCLWSWQDLPEFGRIDGEMCEGVLKSGVVTQDRREKPAAVAVMKRLFQQRRKDPNRPECIVPERVPWATHSRFTPVCLQSLAESDRGEKAWSDLEARMAAAWQKSFWAAHGQQHWKRTGERLLLWEVPEIRIGEAVFKIPKLGHHIRPLVASPAVPEVEIPIRMQGQRLHVLGNVLLPTGYPHIGRLGEPVGHYTVRYADGGETYIPLRHGYEVASANLIAIATRTRPTAMHAPQVLTFAKDVAREQYQFLLYTIPLEGREVARLRIRLDSQDTCLLTLAVTIEV
jgi:hypothetical protein